MKPAAPVTSTVRPVQLVPLPAAMRDSSLPARQVRLRAARACPAAWASRAARARARLRAAALRALALLRLTVLVVLIVLMLATCVAGALEVALPMAPKSVVNVAPWPSLVRGLPIARPRPISRNAGRRMFSRWPVEAIQAATMLRGVDSVPVPQARFSPIVHACLGSM